MEAVQAQAQELISVEDWELRDWLTANGRYIKSINKRDLEAYDRISTFMLIVRLWFHLAVLQSTGNSNECHFLLRPLHLLMMITALEQGNPEDYSQCTWFHVLIGCVFWCFLLADYDFYFLRSTTVQRWVETPRRSFLVALTMCLYVPGIQLTYGHESKSVNYWISFIVIFEFLIWPICHSFAITKKEKNLKRGFRTYEKLFLDDPPNNYFNCLKDTIPVKNILATSMPVAHVDAKTGDSLSVSDVYILLRALVKGNDYTKDLCKLARIANWEIDDYRKTAIVDAQETYFRNLVKAVQCDMVLESDLFPRYQ